MSENGTISEAVSTEEKERLASNVNCDVIVSQPYYVLVDLDVDKAGDSQARFDVGLNFMQSAGLVAMVESWVSKSGKNRHYKIQLNQPLSAIERVAVQAALGSDPIRELLAVFQAAHFGDHNIVLFRPRG